MGDSGVRSYVVFRTDVFVEPAPSVHNDEWSRVVIITVFHSYLPFTVKPKSVYRFTITRKTNFVELQHHSLRRDLIGYGVRLSPFLCLRRCVVFWCLRNRNTLLCSS